MYSFEGDYRRKPQQNLAGASRRYEKSVLLQHAQLQRLKREQQRRRYTAVLKIQALTRGFVARKRARLAKRREYDAEQKQSSHRNLTLDELTTYFQKLLFFYDARSDASRLVWMLQHFLKHRQEIKRRCVNSPEWLWRLRWVLRMCMQHNSEALSNGAYSLAIPLRTLETFTSREETEQVLREYSYKYLEDVFTYLMKHGYFDRLRKLIDNKIPSMLEATSVAPTPMAKCLSDMIKRPLELIGFLEREDDDAFSMLVLRELCRSILSPRMSDPIKMFIVPSLADFAEFPYARLNLCINRMEVEPTISTFYSILFLESHQFSTFKPKNVVLDYLKVLASLSSTIVPLTVIGGAGGGNGQAGIEDSDDSDSESNANAIDRDQADVLHECIEMLNEERHVQGILSAVDRTAKDPAVLQPLCQLCHHLLITDKSAIHKYKLLYMLAFKPGFLKNVWTALLSARQISLFGEATPLLQIVSRGIGLSAEHAQLMVPLLAVFCSLFSLLIATLHDTEFFVEETANERSSLVVEDDDDGDQRRAGAAATATAAMPFTTSELVLLSGHLKGVCLGLVELAFPDSRPTVRDDYKSAVLGPSCTAAAAAAAAAQNRQDTQVWTHLFKVTVALLRQLHTRDLRRQFCPEGHWIASNIAIPIDKRQDFTLRRRRLRGGYQQLQQQLVTFQAPFPTVTVWDVATSTSTPTETATVTTTSSSSLPLSTSSSSSTTAAATNTPTRRGAMNQTMDDGPPLSARKIRTLTLIREIPFVVPFNNRVVVFQSLIHRDKTEQQGELTHFMQGPSIHISVRRNYLYEDAFEKLSPENEPELRLKMRVQLFNTAGLEEAGVDGGGLFREFLSELLKTSFDPNRGFFRLTKDNMLYPNPTVQLLVDDFPKHYYFIGRILGKALYENLLVELPLAEFFLSKIVGRQSDVDVHHLASLDPIMYRNLLYLKSYKGEVAELGLDFTVLSDELGKRRIDELKPGGANIPVTNHNRIEYIHLMADYKLNKQIRAQCYAFKQGIGNVIPLDWLQMFNNKELQVLISGAQIPVDVNDLKTHTNYTGGYTSDHPTIVAFWKVVNEFNDQQKGQLLKFVTSCSRPPLLGFKELDPPFCIQHAGSVDRLPTSSTCMNLLKLPEFPDEKILREKLLYAIQAGAGFELS